MRRHPLLGILAIAWCGCGEDAAPRSSVADAGVPDAGGCGPAERLLEDGRCLVAGVQENGCAAGEQQIDGACVRAGVPPSSCAAGFEADDGGCKAILPAGPCDPGTMALLGETACHPVSPCGAGAWGEILVEASTEHVDVEYTGGASNGSAAAPWTTVVEAVAAAAQGAIVAVAAGSYPGDVVIEDKTIRLYGRCPGLVELVGATSTGAAVEIRAGSDGTEVAGIAVRGAGYGISVRGSTEVIVDRVWIHDTFSYGVETWDVLGPTTLTLTSSLIEHAGGAGIALVGAEALVEDVVIRDSVAEPGLYPGRGITIESSAAPAVVRGAVVERNRGVGIYVGDTTATIEGTLVRDTKLSSQGGARGLSIRGYVSASNETSVEVRGSVIEGSGEVGLMLAGGRATVEDSVVQGTEGAPEAGRGLNVQQFPGDELRPSLTMRRSLVRASSDVALFVDAGDVVLEGVAAVDSGTPEVSVESSSIVLQNGASATIHASAVEQSYSGGIAVVGATALLEGVAVRDAYPGADGFAMCVDASASAARANVTVRSSVLERCAGTAALVTGSDATFESTRIRETRVTGSGHGLGVATQTNLEKNQNVSLAFRFSVIEDGATSGILFQDGEAFVESSLVGSIQAAADGTMGDGIDVIAGTFPTNATILSTRVERAARAAIASFGSAVTVTSSMLECSSLDLVVEENFGKVGTLDDGGGNVCGCADASHTCKALSANLAPPASPPTGP